MYYVSKIDHSLFVPIFMHKQQSATAYCYEFLMTRFTVSHYQVCFCRTKAERRGKKGQRGTDSEET